MSDISTSGDVLELTAFIYLTIFTCSALYHPTAASDEVFVLMLLRLAPPADQRKAIREFLQIERDVRHASNSRPTRLSLLALSKTDCTEWMVPRNTLSYLTGKANEWSVGEVGCNKSTLPPLFEFQDDLRVAVEYPCVRRTCVPLSSGKSKARWACVTMCRRHDTWCCVSS